MTTSIAAMSHDDVPKLRPTLSDRYTLLRPIATGGMAEIFLARQKSLAGFDKHVAIKLLRDRYRGEPRVVEMFLNEARVGAVLNHPNIVHVYDVAEHDKQPFIVMEHIQGDELSQLCRRGLELARFLPLEHAVDLVRQAAEALGYTHARRDDKGHALEIVHRDISPSNLIVTADGVLKIIDFGIARANWPERRDHETGEKLVPGKYNYMSPEQVRGERVDHRSDIFSLGIVLYEITVGKRLFKGRPEEVMQKVTRGRIKPPTFIRRQFPPALERIVMRALEAHRDDRYGSAYELANDLEEFLRDSGLKSGPVRIAQYLDELRGAEGGERRPELIIAGEAWLDDDGEEALDFDRGFSVAVGEKKPATGPKSLARARDVEPAPEPVAEKAEPAPAPAAAAVPVPVPVAAVAPSPVSDDELSTKVGAQQKASLPTETVPLRTVPRPAIAARGPGSGDEEEMTNLRGPNAGLAEPIDSDLGEDVPTDASAIAPDMDPAADDSDRPTPPPLTAPIVLTEPTGRVPLTAVTSKVPLVPPSNTSNVPTARGTGKVPLVIEAGVSAVPLRAEPTGKVTKMAPPPPPVPPPPPPSLLAPAVRAERAAEAARLAALDPSLSTDTPLPPVPDPMMLDDTARHPLADPGLLGIKMLTVDKRAEAPRLEPKAAPIELPALDGNMADSMSVTIGAIDPEAERAQQPKRVSLRGKKKSRPRYRPRNLPNLEITPDPMPVAAFGDHLIAKRQKKLPWPLIIGVCLAVLLVILLMTR
jgi:tRNA A-37 threonylcarbamoyl transferase component Bud32